MSCKRLAVWIAALLLLSPGLAMAERKFSLVPGPILSPTGGQLHIGNGLALPIQAAALPITAGTVFPMTLRIPAAMTPMGGFPVITGTISKPLLTGMATIMGPVTKSGYQRRLSVPAGVLAKPAVPTTVGVFLSNPSVLAVGTNLAYAWPAVPAAFSNAAAVAIPVVASAFGGGGTMTYSNTLGARFGGPAFFALSAGASQPGDLFPGSPFTAYLKIGSVPPCTLMLVGMGPGCLGGILIGPAGGLVPGHGGGTATPVFTPGVVIPGANIAGLKVGLVPPGTLSAGIGTVHATAGSMTAMVPLPSLIAMGAIPTNMASSQPGPWTTGQIIISAPMAMGAPEKFTIEGKDDRTQSGGGTIQMVGGALSARPASGFNGNRAWVRLNLSPIAPVPSMSLGGLAATVALMLLAVGYATRRRIFA